MSKKRFRLVGPDNWVEDWEDAKRVARREKGEEGKDGEDGEEEEGKVNAALIAIWDGDQTAALEYAASHVVGATGLHLSWSNDAAMLSHLARFMESNPLERIRVTMTHAEDDIPSAFYDMVRSSSIRDVCFADEMGGAMMSALDDPLLPPLPLVDTFTGYEVVVTNDVEFTILGMQCMFRLFPHMTTWNNRTFYEGTDGWNPRARELAAIAAHRPLRAFSGFCVDPSNMTDFIDWARTTTVEHIEFTHGDFSINQEEEEDGWRDRIYDAIRSNPGIRHAVVTDANDGETFTIVDSYVLK